MTYPITTNAQVPPDGQLQLTFRPAAAGLVNVTLVGLGIPPPPPTIVPPHSPAPTPLAVPPPPPPPFYTIRLRLEIFKPGTTTPVARTDAQQVVHPGGSNRVVASLNTPASANDLGDDWLARVSNVGDGAVTCRCTARYQVVSGNLGKIDHLVVLMLENRSFDHMLGYLKLEGKRPELEGLTGSEVNRDANNVPIGVHPLATDGRPQPTYFANDPGHGWDDVVEQLKPDSVTGHSNGGFVKNFTKQLANQAKDLPPQWTTLHDVTLIDSQDSTFVAFRPVLPGKVLIHSVLDRHGTHSESGLLAQLILRRPGQSTPVATVKLPLSTTSDPPSLGLSHDVTDAELATPGNWTCEVVNGVMQAVTFTTDVSFMVALHDTRGQEAPAAIMGYYDAAQLPAYDLLAAEFAVCDHWFASLPTDTWPNRLYALAGTALGIDNTPSGAGVPDKPPGYTFSSIFEILQKRQIDWKIFFSDLPFPLVFKELAQHAEYTARMQPLSNFLLAAETGDLPAVAWLEPAFLDAEQAIARDDFANDDHPPGDVARGQQLVQQVFDALSRGPAWAKTLLMITYDEHGGFYDHFPPPNSPPPPDDDKHHAVYGVRVPAFVISPWVMRGSVSTKVFDHTSLLATILRRFCAGSVPSMGQRTNHAQDVGSLLSSTTPRVAPTMAPVPSPVADASTITAADGFGTVLRKTLLGF